MVARAGAALSHVEDGGDLGEGESGGLRIADEPEPINRLIAVISIPVRSALGLGKDPDVLVVADRLGRNADPSGELSYLHGSDSTHLTFHSGGRCTFTVSDRTEQSTMTWAARAAATGAAALLVVVVSTVPALAHGEDVESDPVNSVEQALAIVVNTPDAVDEALERVEFAIAEERDDPSVELNVDALESASAALEEGRLHDAEDALVEALGQEPHGEAAEPGKHGLTERVEGGFAAVSSVDTVVLSGAVAAGVAGIVLVRRKASAS